MITFHSCWRHNRYKHQHQQNKPDTRARSKPERERDTENYDIVNLNKLNIAWFHLVKINAINTDLTLWYKRIFYTHTQSIWKIYKAEERTCGFITHSLILNTSIHKEVIIRTRPSRMLLCLSRSLSSKQQWIDNVAIDGLLWNEAFIHWQFTIFV